MSEPIVVPKPNNAQELFRELTSNEELVEGLTLCGEELGVRLRVVVSRNGNRALIRKQHFTRGIPIARMARQPEYAGLWWVVSETGFSTILKEPLYTCGSWRAVSRYATTRPSHNKPYNVDYLLRNLGDYLTVKAVKIGNGVDPETRLACAKLLALVDRLAAGKLVR